MHPFVVCFRSEYNVLDVFVKSFVAIYDCLEHITAAVSAFQAELLGLLAKDLPSVRKIYYFSDGASSLYKNKKSFLNLCFHESDFHLSAEWNFFATSYGKSTCDGVGGDHQLFLQAEKNIIGITVL